MWKVPEGYLSRWRSLISRPDTLGKISQIALILFEFAEIAPSPLKFSSFSHFCWKYDTSQNLNNVSDREMHTVQFDTKFMLNVFELVVLHWNTHKLCETLLSMQFLIESVLFEKISQNLCKLCGRRYIVFLKFLHFLTSRDLLIINCRKIGINLGYLSCSILMSCIGRSCKELECPESANR